MVKRLVILLAVLFGLAGPASAQGIQTVDALIYNTGTCVWQSGAGSPEGAVTASTCAYWIQTDTPFDLWRKASGAGNTGWVKVTNGLLPPGSGTVTSVALTMPTGFSVSGSPITTSGTLGVTFDTQLANLVLAGPASGSAATPAFRALTFADLPSGGAYTVLTANGGVSSFSDSPVVNDITLMEVNPIVTFKPTVIRNVAAGEDNYASAWQTSPFDGAGHLFAYNASAYTPFYMWASELRVESGARFAGNLLPKLSDSYAMGGADKWWSQAYITQINSFIMSLTTQTVFGGYSTIGKDAGVLTAVGSADTTVDFGDSMTVGDFVQIRAANTIGTNTAEFMTVGSLVSGTTYNVTRNLSGIGAQNWAAGVPYLVLGHEGDGRIDMLNENGKPRIVFTQQGATYNAQTPRVAIGNLNTYCNYTDDIWGFCAGTDTATNVTIDADDGFRILSGTTPLFAVDTSGNLSMTGNLSIGTSGLIRSGATDYATGTGWILDYNSGTPRFRVGTTAGNRLTWDGTNFTMVSAGVTIDSGGLKLAISDTFDPATTKSVQFTSSTFNGTIQIGSGELTGTANNVRSLVVDNTSTDVAAVVEIRGGSTTTPDEISIGNSNTHGGPSGIYFQSDTYNYKNLTSGFGCLVSSGSSRSSLTSKYSPCFSAVFDIRDYGALSDTTCAIGSYNGVNRPTTGSNPAGSSTVTFTLGTGTGSGTGRGTIVTGSHVVFSGDATVYTVTSATQQGTWNNTGTASGTNAAGATTVNLTGGSGDISAGSIVRFAGDYTKYVVVSTSGSAPTTAIVIYPALAAAKSSSQVLTVIERPTVSIGVSPVLATTLGGSNTVTVRHRYALVNDDAFADAIAAAGVAGGTVYVPPGIWSASATIDLTVSSTSDTISLEGAGAWASSICTSVSGSAGIKASTIDTRFQRVANLSIESTLGGGSGTIPAIPIAGTDGIFIREAGFQTVIDSVYVKAFPSNAVYVTGQTGPVVVRDSHLQNNAGYGVYVAGLSGVYPQNVMVDGGSIQHQWGGIKVEGGALFSAKRIDMELGDEASSPCVWIGSVTDVNGIVFENLTCSTGDEAIVVAGAAVLFENSRGTEWIGGIVQVASPATHNFQINGANSTHNSIRGGYYTNLSAGGGYFVAFGSSAPKYLFVDNPDLNTGSWGASGKDIVNDYADNLVTAVGVATLTRGFAGIQSDSVEGTTMNASSYITAARFTAPADSTDEVDASITQHTTRGFVIQTVAGSSSDFAVLRPGNAGTIMSVEHNTTVLRLHGYGAGIATFNANGEISSTAGITGGTCSAFTSGVCTTAAPDPGVTIAELLARIEVLEQIIRGGKR